MEHRRAFDVMRQQQFTMTRVIVVAVCAQPGFGNQIAAGDQLWHRIDTLTRQNNVDLIKRARNKLLTRGQRDAVEAHRGDKLQQLADTFAHRAFGGPRRALVADQRRDHHREGNAHQRRKNSVHYKL